MDKTIDEVYASIGQQIAGAIKDYWSEAWLFVEFFEDAANFKGEYDSDSERKHYEVPDDVFDDFDVLYEITTEGGSNRWNRAKFTLYPDGKFNIDFQWDQALADEIAANS
ncbi:immunity protein YezG family protein [Parendozoicomonas sp. Alg238-R29]|uniref:immunity protein YezG family protein n=1 Tax=Parendozoicomonas sp. Alg238-R29 TaxID=2993446 RepID=UPI00248D5B29|nr:immunity protein YezG family protein [Parendozoicomonas sp. Alg238-R29]